MFSPYQNTLSDTRTLNVFIFYFKEFSCNRNESSNLTARGNCVRRQMRIRYHLVLVLNKRKLYQLSLMQFIVNSDCSVLCCVYKIARSTAAGKKCLIFELDKEIIVLNS